MKSSSDVEVRTADETDAPAILHCLATAFAPYRSQYTPAAYADTVLNPETLALRLRHMHVLVATLEGKIIGTVAGTKTGDLRGMAVLPECHGQGIAGKLLNAMEDWLRSCACTQITLDTTEPLQPAISFYERNGFHRSGKITDFFGMPLIEYLKYL
jgi:ribosomal protein S18 acetylase RimI-like enzyme